MSSIKSAPWLVLLWLLALVPAHADTPLPAMAVALDKILDVPGLKGGIVGAAVARVSDGQMLYSQNLETRLTPASNRKLYTAAAALELLGGDYVLKTQARAAERPDAQGVLHGEIVLRGGGDGLLSVADLDTMAQDVARAGVKQVTGGVCGDGTLFRGDPYGEGWEWDDLSDDYAPQITALEVNEGIVMAHVTAGERVGDPVTVTVDPPVGYLPVACDARTGAKNVDADVQISRPFDANYLAVGGTVPLGATVDGTTTVADPARFAATVFRQALVKNGVAIDGPAFSALIPTTPDAILLASHESLPLAQYLAKMDKPSDNLLAESLWRLLGAVKGQGGDLCGRPGRGRAVPARPGPGHGHADSRGRGPASPDVTSSRRSPSSNCCWRCTARLTGTPITTPCRSPAWTGRCGRRMIGTPAAGNVHAKTGSLTGVSSLSGYVTGRDGTLYAFCLMMNNFPGTSTAAHAAQDAFAEWLAGP